MFASLICAAYKRAAASSVADAVKSSAIGGTLNASNKQPLSQTALGKEERAYLNDLKARMPEKPVRSGYQLWIKEHKIEDLKFANSSATYASTWINVEPEVKEEYKERVAAAKDEYHAELAAFKRSLSAKQKSVLENAGIKLPLVKRRMPQGTVNPWMEFTKRYRAAHPPADNTLVSCQALMKAASVAYRAGRSPEE